MSVPLFLVESLGAPRNHHALFVRLDEGDGSGELFNVIGGVQNGMAYESKPTKRPEASVSYVTMTQLGWVSSSDLRRIDSICRSNPPPEKQFNGAKRINPKKPLRRCQEWTLETIELLKTNGVLKSGVGKSFRTSQSTGSANHGRSSASTSSHSSRSYSSSTHAPADGKTSSDGYWTWNTKYGDWYHVSSDGQTLWASQQSSGSKGKNRH